MGLDRKADEISHFFVFSKFFLVAGTSNGSFLEVTPGYGEQECGNFVIKLRATMLKILRYKTYDLKRFVKSTYIE